MNPEALRFPSDLRIKVLAVIGFMVDLLCAAVVIFKPETVGLQVFGAITICLLVAFKLHFWPREIVADQFGIHSIGLFSPGNVHIAWQEVCAIRPSTEVPGFGPRVLGLRNDTLEFESLDASARVVHTSHHPDRDRLVREVALRGVAVHESALT